MRIRSRWAMGAALVGAALGVGGSIGWVTQVAAAPAGCGSLPAGNAVYIDCAVSPASAPYTTYSDGQQVDLSMGPNSMFGGAQVGRDIVAIECEYSTGTGPGDPPDTNFCSAQTLAGGFPYAVGTNGAFDYSADQHGDTVTMFALPDASLSGATIKCDSAHPCVWYVGTNYNDFKAPHVFSNPFVVSATGSSPGAATTAPPSTSTSITSTSGMRGNATPQLAYTGPTALPVWTAALGFVLMVAGLVGRKLLLRAGQ